MKDKKYCKVRYHCHYTGKYKSAVHSTCNLKYSVPKKIPIVFHSESNYDYHFIIKESAVEFKKQFTCLGEETEIEIITLTIFNTNSLKFIILHFILYLFVLHNDGK